MKPNIGDLAKLERLLADGYLVRSPAVRVAELKRSPILACPRDFDWREYCGDPASQDKFLVMLWHPLSGEWVEMLVPDEVSATRANKQFTYQQEQIGVRIEVSCAVRSAYEYDQCQLHLDELARSLNGFQGWEFATGQDVGTMKIKIQIQDGGKISREEAFEKMERLFDILAVTHGIGFQIFHVCIFAIRRHPTLPEFGTPGLNEWMVPQATVKQIMIEDCAWPSDIWQLAHALRDIYWETLPAGRLVKLWAAIEAVLAGDPEHLLAPDEIQEIKEYACTIQSLKDNPERLNKFKAILGQQKTFPKKGIEDRLAERIAPILGISVGDAGLMVGKAKKLRGEQVHTLVKDLGRIRESEESLLNALRGYITQRIQP